MSGEGETREVRIGDTFRDPKSGRLMQVARIEGSTFWAVDVGMLHEPLVMTFSRDWFPSPEKDPPQWPLTRREIS